MSLESLMPRPAPMVTMVDLTVPPEQRTTVLELHMASAVPGDRAINITERGTSRIEALERLVVEIDRAVAKLYAARDQAMELIQVERKAES